MERIKGIVKRKLNVAMALAFAAVGVITLASCMEKTGAASNPPGYDLSNPVKYNMPDKLLEISGITFRNGKADMLYAEEDERGRVYHFKLGDQQIPHSTFGQAGDYEDIAILGDKVIMLRSDGALFTFPVTSLTGKDIAGVKTQTGLLPAGEYEGMYADYKTNQLYILCKNCAEDKGDDSSSGYIFKSAADGTFKRSGQFRVALNGADEPSGKKKKKKRVSFRPSAMAKNQSTNEWYILSSVNKMIVVTDAAFKMKAVYPIRAGLFLQPEGIAFDDQNNLYISNEGDKITPGNVLKFVYKK